MWLWLALLSILAFLEDAAEPLRCLYETWNAEKPVRVFSPPPDYPEAARQAEIEGRVLVEGAIANDGSIENARIIAFEPSDVFNDSALTTFQSWRYCPVQDGIDPKVRVALVFKLDRE